MQQQDRLEQDRLEQLASRQFGLVSRRQALDLGLTPAVIGRRLARGLLRAAAPGVYSFPGHRPSWKRDLWIAYLHAGPTAVVSHQSAGRINDLDGLGLAITLIVARLERHVPAGVVWHRLDDLDPRDVMEVDGLRVTTPSRTVVDLAAVIGRTRLRHVIEDGIVKGHLDVASVGAVLDRVRRRGKPGVAKLCDTLDLLGPGDGLPRSELERILDDAIARSGLPAPVHEHPLPAVRGLRGFADRYFPDARLIVEADGRKWHERRQAMARDAERDLEAARSGVQTVRMMWEHLASDPGGMATALREIHRIRTAAA